MQYVHFLNLEYFLVLVYRVITGTNIDVTQIPAQTLAIMTVIAWVGIGLSIIFLTGFFIVRKKLHAVEHAGWHRREHEEEEMLHKHNAEVPINPHWEHVLTLAGGPTESDWRRAIVEADIMLNLMLSDRGYTGDTVADKLKSANPLQFTTLELAWAAHRVRNQIAHEGLAFTLTERDARATIDNYRRVFEEFDYL